MLSRERANAMLMSAVILCLGLGAAVWFLWQRNTDPSSVLDLAMADPELRREVVSELVTMSYGAYDSHPDPDIGRIFQPEIKKQQGNLGEIVTNRWGLREKDFSLPKTPGTVRVVLLGDSYVFGNLVRPEQRFGVHLEQYLRDMGVTDGRPVECLHVGVPSWNILAECAFARRLLTDLQPDLLIQVVVPNDLDDLEGVRGFGTLARFTPHHRERGSSLVTRSHARRVGFRSTNFYLLDGLDAESLGAYNDARRAMIDLAGLVEESGGRYLLLLNWMAKLQTGDRLLTAGLSEQQVALLPFSLFLDESLKISPNNGHWNPAGHEHVARYLYSLIRRDDLLPDLDLRPFPEADRVRDALLADVARELDAPDETPHPPLSTLDFTDWTLGTIEQIYAGLGGVAAGPYVSVVLAVDGGRTLQIEGQHLDSPAMADARTRIMVENQEIGTIAYRPGLGFRFEQALPAHLAGRNFVNVTLISDDYILMGDDRRETISLMVGKIAILP